MPWSVSPSRCACAMVQFRSVTIGITGATGHAFAADAASAHLTGKPLSSQDIAHAAALASEQAECLSDGYASADYRKHLVKTEVARALTSLADA